MPRIARTDQEGLIALTVVADGVEVWRLARARRRRAGAVGPGR